MKFTFPFSVSILLSLFIGMLNRSDEALPILEETQLSAPHKSKGTESTLIHRPGPFITQYNESAALLTAGTSALLAPAITATKTAVLVTDNGTTGATPTDVIEYTVTIANTGPDDATGVIFTDIVDPNTTLVPGSVKSAPIAVKDAYSTVGNVSISVPAASGLTSNDVNLDGDVLNVTGIDVTGTEGQVTFNANGSFTFNPTPGFTGATTFTYTISDGTFTSTNTVTITMTGMIWFIDDNATAPGDGRLGSAFSSIANFNSIAADDPNDNIFLYSGSYSSAGFTLLNGQNLIGQGTDEGTLAALAGVTFSVHPPISGSIPTTGGTNPTIAHNAAAITTGQNNDIYGVTINNTGGTAFIASSFGTLKVRDVILSNSGGQGINFNTGTLDVIFPSVTVSNAGTGIYINNTTGSFQITGSGTTDASGGTLTNITGRGIEIRNATNITLRNMSLPSANSSSDAGFDTFCDEDDVNACFAAIYMNIVNTATFHNIDIGATEEHGIMGLSVSNLTMDNCTAVNNGDAPSEDESALKLRNLSGTCSITNSTFETSAVRTFHLINNTGSLSLTVNNCIFNDPTGADCFEARTQGSATATINLTNSRFQRAGTKGIQIVAEGSSTLSTNINNCKVERFGGPMAGIEVASVGTATINYNIVNCTDIEASQEVAVLSSTFNTSILNGRLNNNTNIGHNAGAPTIFSTIRMLHEQNSSAKYEIRDNTNITLVNGEATIQGIARVATTSAGRLDFFVDRNNLTRDNASLEGIEIRLGGTGAANDEFNILCSDVLDNNVTGSSGTRAIRVRDLDDTSGDLRLQGDNGPNVPTYWVDRGNMNSAGMMQAETGTPAYFVSTATCIAPSHPTARIAAEPLAIDEPKTELVEVAQVIEDPKQEIDNQAATPSAEEIQKAAEETARKAVVLSGETVTVGGMGGFLLPAGQNIIIKFRVSIDSPLPPGKCQISNQGSVSGSNFSTVLTDDVAGSPVNPTVTQLSKHSLGNLVYRDNNKNNIFDGGDVGINGVTVNLYLDANGNGVLDVGDGASIANTTTAGGGLYTFSNLCSEDYIVQIPSTEFGSGQELNGLISSPGGTAPDPDNNTDNDDNGQDAINSSIASQAITLAYNGADIENNATLDFGFRTPTIVNIDNVTLSEGSGGGTTNFTFTVSRDNTSDAFDLIVNTGVVSPNNSDYTPIVGGTVSFTAGGSLMTTVTVLVTADDIVEASETFNVLLSGAPDGIIISDGTGLGTINNDDAATVTLTGGTSQNEGTAFTFTATLNNPVQGGFTVPYTTNNGITNPATTADNDYTDNDGPALSFAGTAGESHTITVNTTPDNKVELNETFTVALGAITGAPAGVTTAGSPQTGTITNDDQAVVSINSISQSEATSPQAFSITLSNPVDVAVSMTTNTSDGSAMTTDSDYGAISNGTVTFGVNSTTAQNVNVTITPDNKVEANEVFNLTLSALNANGRNVIFSGNTPTLATTGTIQNDDNATVTLSGGGAANEGNSGTNNRTFTATLNNPVQGGFTLAYTTNDGSATTADNDYVDNDGPALSFMGNAGESKTITVQVNGDLNIEADETFTVSLGTITALTTVQTNAITTPGSPQTATITNDEQDWGDAPTSAQSGFISSYPTASGVNGARHSVALGGLRLGATIDADLDGQPTATASGDGADEDGVTLPAALITNTTASITVNASAAGILNAWVDFNRDGDWGDTGEQIFVNTNLMAGNNSLTFAVPAGASLGTSFARFRLSTTSGLAPTGAATDGEVEDYQVSILDNQYSISSPTVAEGNAGPTNLTFAVSRTNGTGTGSVDYSIPTGTATSGTDYNAIVAGTINFADTETSKNVIVTVNGDNIVEDNETVIITLSNPVNGGIGAMGVGTGTINNDDNATVTLTGGIAKNEGNAGTNSYTFTATLNNPVQGGFTVAYSTSDGTATTADNDYVDNDGPALGFTGTAGETKTITVLVNGDNKVEVNETFTVALGSITAAPAGVSVGGSTQTGTITNDDNATVTLTGGIAQNEGNAGTSSYTFTATLNNPVQGGFTVAYSTSDGTATTADNDYVDNDGPALGFTGTAGETKTITVLVNGDNKVEVNETFTVALGSITAAPAGVSVGGSTQTGTITNDDNATVTLSAVASPLQHPEGNTGNTNFVFTATLNNPVQGGFQVAYTTSDGTALSPEDYIDNDASLTFAGTANETQTITVQAKGDLKVEANESFFVALGAITNAPAGVTANTTQLQGLIVNDELDWGDAPDSYGTLNANNGARHNTSIAFHLGATVDGDLDGQPSATANGDDTDAEGDDDDGVTLPSVLVTNTTANVTVNASGAGFLNAWVDFNNNGNWNDPGEQVFNNTVLTTGNNNLSFAVPAGATPSTTFARFRYTTATVGSPSPVGLQTDGEVEDYAIQIVNTQFSINDPIVTEGNAGTTNLTFTISRTVNANACSVNYAITGGTATSGSDYQTLASGTVSFSAGGVPSQTVTVVVTGDQTVELNETVLMTLSMPVNGSILDGEGTGTINNDDAATITISNPSVAEGSSGTANLTFNINMSNPSDANVVLNYNTVDATATTADNDYQAASGAHTFSPGQTTKQVTVLVNGDCKVESNETLLLRLSNLINNGRNVTLSGGGATLDGTATIQNTPLPTASIAGTTIVCQNATSPNITFTGAAGTAPYTFTYKINNGPDLTVTTSAMSNNVTVSVPTTSAGNFVYTLLSVSDVHCSQTQTGSASVLVNPLPTATIVGTTAVCQNSNSPNITFTGANATAPYTFTYKINNGPDLTVTSVGNTATVSVPTASIGSFVYSLVSVKDASSTQCSQNQMGAATVTVNPLPTATIVGTTAVCQNSNSPNITFTGANATAPYTFTYKINNGPDLTVTSVGNTATVSVPTASVGSFVYSLVSVKDASSTQCSQNQMGAATITVNPLPTATIVGTTAVCQNSNSPNITFTGANATAPYTFTYKINNGPDLTVTSVGNTATVSVPTASVGSFVYSLVSVKDASSTQCSQNQMGAATVTVNPLPTATIMGTIALCQNAPFPQVTFTGNNATAPYTFTYKINGGPDLTVTSVGNTATISQSTATAGVFTYTLVSVKDASSTQCSQNQSGSAVITIHAPPVVSTPQSSLCTGLTMTLSPTSGGTWQSSNPSIATVNNAGLVTAIMAGSVNFTFTQTSTGCSSTTSNIIIKPTPTSNLTASKYDVCPNTEVTLNPNCSIPTSTVNWNPGAPTVTPAAATLPYVYKARCTADGCTGNESSVEVRTHRILVDMKDLDVGALPLPIVRAVKDNMAPTNLIQAPVFPRRWTFIANGCDASESAEFKLSGPVLFNTIDNSGTYAMFANEGNSFYSIDHPNYGNGGSFPNGTYTLTINFYSKDGVGGPFPKNRIPVGILLATRTLEFTVGGQQSIVGGRQSAVVGPSHGSEQWTVGSGQWAVVAPNPVSNTMRLKVMDLKGQQVKVNLIDAAGRMMLQHSFTPDTNQHQEEFEVSQLSAGMYFLNVNTENKNATIKVVKVE